ncbi:hypothetical protein PsorP6_012259 [Peronosclerospora sorghi]|uniref:Uncharacterized protein n=1 Tax=Peronosclerospora sorghi TaxID=230839 RepID=A0ACC0WHE6_9STRA|nr:hypothetical protein PsorP6_012259 [Peronosclerospora sorghi]
MGKNRENLVLMSNDFGLYTIYNWQQLYQCTKSRTLLLTLNAERYDIIQCATKLNPSFHLRAVTTDDFSDGSVVFPFPHLSSRVRSLVPGASASDLPLKRVVVGLNLFPTEIDASVAKFPEHSGAFNRYVNLSHAAVKQTPRLYSPRHGGGWTLASVRYNPKQAAFLKLLVRKVREQKEKTATAET